MKLWILEGRDDLSPGDDPWWPRWDKTHSFVVRAESEERARQLATEGAAEETEGFPDVWLDAGYSTCTELTQQGEEGVVIFDHVAG